MKYYYRRQGRLYLVHTGMVPGASMVAFTERYEALNIAVQNTSLARTNTRYEVYRI